MSVLEEPRVALIGAGQMGGTLARGWVEAVRRGGGLTLTVVEPKFDPAIEHALEAAGAVLTVVWLGALSLALIGAPTRGWTSPATLALVGLAVVTFVAFLAVERRAINPTLPLELFRERRFSAINTVTFVIYGALTGALFLLPIVLQTSAGYSPMASGLATLPITVILLVGSAPSGIRRGRT